MEVLTHNSMLIKYGCAELIVFQLYIIKNE